MTADSHFNLEGFLGSLCGSTHSPYHPCVRVCERVRGSIKTISVTTRCSSFRVSLSWQTSRSTSWPKEICFADRLVIPVPCTELCTKSFAYSDRLWNLGDKCLKVYSFAHSNILSSCANVYILNLTQKEVHPKISAIKLTFNSNQTSHNKH